MVEGPGCKVKGETMKPRVKGMMVVALSGTALKKKSGKKRERTGGTTKASSVNESEFDVLLSKQVSDVKTLGKELFMFFEDFHLCLRLHFLMSGGYRLNGKKLDHEGGGEADSPTLVLHLLPPGARGQSKPALLTFNKSAADVRAAQPSLERISDLLSLDICADQFNPQRALALVMEQTKRQVCDVLLDQQILPGVGNIIKNEALFDSAMKPDSLVGEFTEAHLVHLIKMTRDFSMLFYRCRRDGKPLSPHLKIYNRSVCKACKGRCVVTKLGEDLCRLTYFCPQCQDNDFTRFNKRQVVNKSSLLGWMTGSGVTTNTTPPPDWSCTQCTLINSGQRANCSVCHNPKGGRETLSAPTPSPNADLQENSHHLAINNHRNTKKQDTSTPTRVNGFGKWMTGQQVDKESFQNDLSELPETQSGSISHKDNQITTADNHINSRKVNSQTQVQTRNIGDMNQMVTLETVKNKQDVAISIDTLDQSTDSCGSKSTISESVCVTRGDKSFRFRRKKSINSLSNSPHEAKNHSVCDQFTNKPICDSESNHQNVLLDSNRKPFCHAVCKENLPGITETRESSISSSPQARPPLRSVSLNQAPSESQAKLDQKKANSKGSAASASPWEPVACLSEVVKCEAHKVKSVMRQVHKKGDNLHRMFWSCPRRCNHFKWADEGFPVCDGHKRRSVLRTVFKQGPNNTRRFFACPLPKNKQCGFFQWAELPKS